MSHHTFLMQQCKILWQKQDAVTSVEYALIGSLIAVLIVGGVGVVGTSLSTFFYFDCKLCDFHNCWHRQLLLS
jgi:Flp pilus assembly pilin Flp